MVTGGGGGGGPVLMLLYQHNVLELVLRTQVMDLNLVKY